MKLAFSKESDPGSRIRVHALLSISDLVCMLLHEGIADCSDREAQSDMYLRFVAQIVLSLTSSGSKIVKIVLNRVESWLSTTSIHCTSYVSKLN